jgi:urease accessory protein
MQLSRPAAREEPGWRWRTKRAVLTSLVDAAGSGPNSSHETWQARLELRFAASSHQTGRTHLANNRHYGPLMVQKALYPEGPGVCHCVVLHPPAGIAAGDQLSIDVSVGENAHALLSTPSATRWYKSSGRVASQQVHLTAEAGAALEWLPEENLFYDSVCAVQDVEIEIQDGARLLAWDSFMLGRQASDVPWLSGRIELKTHIRRAGQLLYSERGMIEACDQRFAGGPGLNGFRCGATLYAAAAGFDATEIERLAGSLPYDPELIAGCSELAPGLIMMRILGREASAVRQLLHRVWGDLRPAVIGLEPRPLRLWAC